MECYEGATMIKTFRGIIADGAQDTILLHTNDGSTGYRITKLRAFPNLPGTTDYESTIQVWKTAQTGISTSTATVDFSDNELLGAIFVAGTISYITADSTQFVIFDDEIFNQDIYITHTNTEGAASMNYYLELEQIKLDINQNTVATLKDMRNTASPKP
jgi:hypothetical protein